MKTEELKALALRAQEVEAQYGNRGLGFLSFYQEITPARVLLMLEVIEKAELVSATGGYIDLLDAALEALKDTTP